MSAKEMVGILRKYVHQARVELDGADAETVRMWAELGRASFMLGSAGNVLNAHEGAMWLRRVFDNTPQN